MSRPQICNGSTTFVLDGAERHAIRVLFSRKPSVREYCRWHCNALVTFFL